jgi:hypothetical protein
LAHAPHHPLLPARKIPSNDVLPRLAHQPKVEAEVVQRGNHATELLPRYEEVAQVGQRVGAARVARACWVNGRMLVFPLLVADIDDALGCVKVAVAGVAGRQHAVEHVNAEGDAFEDVHRGADAHQVAGLVLWQDAADQLCHGVHVLVRLADAETADGVALPLERGDNLRRLFAQVGVGAALYDGEQRLGISVQPLRFIETVAAALEPAVGEAEGVLSVFVLAGVGRTLVEGHDDVRPNFPLDVHRPLRGENVLRAVNMRLECDALLLYLSLRSKGIHLVAAAVRQNGALPAIEFMQAARRFQHIHAGPKVEVVGIAEDDLRPHLPLQFVYMHRFYGACRTHGHEDGRLDGSVRRLDAARPCGGVGVGMLKLKIQTMLVFDGAKMRKKWGLALLTIR